MATKTRAIRFRVEEEKGAKAQHWAEMEGATLSDVMRAALDAYLADEQAHLRRTAARGSSGLRLDRLAS